MRFDNTNGALSESTARALGEDGAAGAVDEADITSDEAMNFGALGAAGAGVASANLPGGAPSVPLGGGAALVAGTLASGAADGEDEKPAS